MSSHPRSDLHTKVLKVLSLTVILDASIYKISHSVIELPTCHFLKRKKKRNKMKMEETACYTINPVGTRSSISLKNHMNSPVVTSY